MLADFPPIMHRWFTGTFTEPAAWFGARTAFAHTAAVWSIVGHICGLGDRHGENLLLDTTTGDCVHVDFSCLFDKGLELDKPEMVPFRLTQNIVDGLGVTGTEGVFLQVCEIMLATLRAHREPLMTVLETFIHDPLLEWTRKSDPAGSDARPRGALEKIRSRLEGVVVGVGAAPSLPLSPAGQARRLVEEAVSHDNLGRMYIWWHATRPPARPPACLLLPTVLTVRFRPTGCPGSSASPRKHEPLRHTQGDSRTVILF